MVKRLIPIVARLIALASVVLSVSACISTEALYAEYDAANCKFVIQESPAGALSLRELISNTHFPWEPAVYFDFNHDSLDERNTQLLEGAVQILTRYPQLNLSLQGFADRIGTRHYNMDLATRRVASVRDYLHANGIGLHRIVDQPLGEGLSRFGDDDDLSRSINRRVELMLLDEQGRPLHPLFDFKGL